MAPIVTLTTDFGLRDPYVGEMKAAVLSACPAARLVDVTHDIEPGDIHEGMWVLGRVWERFPPETVHVAVVDPGVGSERLPIAVRCRKRWLVGPDNGVLSGVLARGPAEMALAIEAHRIAAGPPSDTFHGRDIFAPAAGLLASGAGPDAVGQPMDATRLIRLPVEEPSRDGPRIQGRVIHVDRFGNLVTDIPVSWLPEAPTAMIAGRHLQGIERSYAAVPRGGLLMTRGSGGTLEISARGTSAAALLGVGRGEVVIVTG